jgi:hypothetical protein
MATASGAVRRTTNVVNHPFRRLLVGGLEFQIQIEGGIAMAAAVFQFVSVERIMSGYAP